MQAQQRLEEHLGAASITLGERWLAPLPYALMQAVGEEARSFLHGQLSSDVAALLPESSQLSSYNSPKGRVLALFRLFHRGEALALRLPASLAEVTQQRLKMFILRSKVEIQLVDIACLGIKDDSRAMRLRHQGLPLPETAETVTRQGDIQFIRAPGEGVRLEAWGPVAAVAELAETLKADGFAVATAAAWEWEEIRAGLPEVYPETREAFVPQMLNLHRLGGVSFNKGCYPGQEVVARMHYLGKLKRRLFRIRIPTVAPPAPGTPLLDPQGTSQGKVVRAARGKEGCEALAVVALSAVEDKIPLTVAGTGPVEWLPLPYAVDDRA